MWWDLNNDGLFTISDIWALVVLLFWLLVLLFFLPANLILMVMYWLVPGIPAFLELSPTYEYTMGWGTGITSGILWAMGYLIIGGFWEDIREDGRIRQRERREEEERQRQEAESTGKSANDEDIREELEREIEVFEPEETDEARLQRVSSWFETLTTSAFLGDQFLPFKLPILSKEEEPELFYGRNEKELKSTPGYKKLVDECEKRGLSVRFETDYFESAKEQIEWDVDSFAPTLYHVYVVVSQPE